MLLGSEEDVQAGCVDRGPLHAWAPGRRVSVNDGITRALSYLQDATPSARIAAMRRLALLGRSSTYASILPLIQDEDREVRKVAFEVGTTLAPAQSLPWILAQLASEHDPELLAWQLELVALSGGDQAAQALACFLQKEERDPRAHTLIGDVKPTPVIYRVVELASSMDSLAVVPALLDILDEEDGVLRAKAADALAALTNHRPTATDWTGVNESADAIAAARGQWREVLGPLALAPTTQARTWLRGFEAAGYPVNGTTREVAATLARACGDERTWIRMNAQRLLMQMTGNRPDSLQWPPEDAQAYWLRWTEQNRSRIVAVR